VQELRKMVDQFSLDVVQAYMRHVQDNAEESVRRVITRLKDGAFTLALDNGAQIQVAIRVDAASRSAEIDFTGTSRRSRPTTSTRPRRSAWRRCCMCSARWWTTTSR
jgi:5-oxoprolinase (ATP-hydrolysing)